MLAASTVALPLSGRAQAQRTVKIGWTDWSDCEAISNLTKYLLEKHLNYKADMVKASIADLFAGIADGRLDFMQVAWLPNTHKTYWDQYATKVMDLGALYTGTRIGWVVPTYATDLKSIEDLNKPEVKSKLGSKIWGIEPGSGLMKASRTALTQYGLTGYDLQDGKEDTLAQAAEKAFAAKAPVVLTAWTPHWLFSKYNLTYLRDSKNVFGGAEEVQALGRPGLDKAHPEVTRLLQQMKMPIKDLETLMYISKMEVFKSDGKEVIAERTAKMWVGTQRKLVSSWFSGIKSI